MCICLELILRIGKPMYEFIPGRDCFLLSQQLLTSVGSSSMSWIMWNFPSLPWHINWCYHYAGLLQANILLRIHGCSFPVVPRGYHLSIFSLWLWLLESFYLFLHGFPSALCLGIALKMNQLG